MVKVARRVSGSRKVPEDAELGEPAPLIEETNQLDPRTNFKLDRKTHLEREGIFLPGKKTKYLFMP